MDIEGVNLPNQKAGQSVRRTSTTGFGKEVMAPKVLRRPGARVRPPVRRRGDSEGVMRRPALREEEKEVEEAGGMWRSIPELTMEEIGNLDKVVVEGRYWEAPCLIAGVVSGLNFRGGDRKLRIRVTGTQVGGRCRDMEVHLCGQPCENLVWNNDLVHGDRLMCQEGPPEGWWSNLEEVKGRGLGMMDELDQPDQLAKLRTEMKRVVEGVNAEDYSPEGANAPAAEGEKERKTSKKKVKKKEKEKIRPCLEEPLKDIFARTGVDLDPQTRKVLMRKARKIRRGKSMQHF